MDRSIPTPFPFPVEPGDDTRHVSTNCYPWCAMDCPRHGATVVEHYGPICQSLTIGGIVEGVSDEGTEDDGPWWRTFMSTELVGQYANGHYSRGNLPAYGKTWVALTREQFGRGEQDTTHTYLTPSAARSLAAYLQRAADEADGLTEPLARPKR